MPESTGSWELGPSWTVTYGNTDWFERKDSLYDAARNGWITTSNTYLTSSSTTMSYTVNWTADETRRGWGLPAIATGVRTRPYGDAIQEARREEARVQARLAAHDEIREARTAARIVARDRADELLVSMLDTTQRETYRLTGEFMVIGSAGGLYRIKRGTSGNVEWIAMDGQPGARLCAHPEMREGWLPDQDVALAQLLALTTDEPAFVARANVHWGRRPTHLVGA